LTGNTQGKACCFFVPTVLTQNSGNRDDYKIVPNDQREWEIEGFQLLLEALRQEIGPEKLLSLAVPGLQRDLIAFTDETVPRIERQVDFLNIMTYDLMNRRDTQVKHHSGVQDSRQSIQRYLDRGVPREKANLGLGYYVKWFMTEECSQRQLLSCPTQVLEDPVTGDDLGRTGAFSWHDTVPEELANSFSRAVNSPQYFDDGSVGFWDQSEQRWWSYDTDRVVRQKIAEIIRPMGLGGVFAWGLGEDAPDFTRLRATIAGLQDTDSAKLARDEL
jgi:GH18 family chitinase